MKQIENELKYRYSEKKRKIWERLETFCFFLFQKRIGDACTIVEEYKLPHFHLVLDGTVALTKTFRRLSLHSERIYSADAIWTLNKYIVNDLNISIYFKIVIGMNIHGNKWSKYTLEKSLDEYIRYIKKNESVF